MIFSKSRLTRFFKIVAKIACRDLTDEEKENISDSLKEFFGMTALLVKAFT